jgi:hypothetical protein
MKYNTTEIKQDMADHKVSRSTAVRHLYKTKAPKLAPVVDVKQKAANDKPEPKVDANVARAAGLKLFNTAPAGGARFGTCEGAKKKNNSCMLENRSRISALKSA